MHLEDPETVTGAVALLVSDSISEPGMQPFASGGGFCRGGVARPLRVTVYHRTETLTSPPQGRKSMDTAERFDLATRNTAEVVEESELEALFEEGSPSAYIGYAPTGEMHIGHFTTMRKLADFLNAGMEVTVLIADLHAHLDDNKSPFDLLNARSAYYQESIEAMIDAAGADADTIEFVRGSDF